MRPPLRTRTAPVLVWRAVARATYYDVILWRGGRRVLDLWPATSHVTIPASWVRRGHRFRLVPGRYLWFAYPGFGPKAAHHYGNVAASGTLVVPTGA